MDGVGLVYGLVALYVEALPPETRGDGFAPLNGFKRQKCVSGLYVYCVCGTMGGGLASGDERWRVCALNGSKRQTCVFGLCGLVKVVMVLWVEAFLPVTRDGGFAPLMSPSVV